MRAAGAGSDPEAGIVCATVFYFYQNQWDQCHNRVNMTTRYSNKRVKRFRDLNSDFGLLCSTVMVKIKNLDKTY